MIKRKKLIAVALTSVLTLGVGLNFPKTALSSIVKAQTTYKNQNLDGTDHLDSLDNPERGFYVPSFLVLKESNNQMVKTNDALVHLRIDLSAFSSNAKLDSSTYGTSKDLSEDALLALSNTLECIKKSGHSVIVRRCYDHYFDGHSNCEPSQEQIIRHLKQLAKVYTKYKDVIAYIELGTYGPWGEMHTSTCCTKNNVSEALNTMLSNTPKELAIGVRTPGYVAGWLGMKESDFSLGGAAYEAAMKKKGVNALRVGMFNDGYLGSESDLGTYGTITREKGVKWLGERAKTTFYGGEVVADSNGGIIGKYNSIDYISKEAFDTHTTYLNTQWNYQVIDEWKKQKYQNDDDEYNGENGFKYVADHLGYRLLLRKSELSDEVTDRVLHMRYTIENVGFGNIIKNKVATIVLEDQNQKFYEIPFANCNPTKLWSAKLNIVNGDISLPSNLSNGTYKVYLRFSEYGQMKSDQNYHCIQFANSSDYWKEGIGANYVGEFVNRYVKPVSTTTENQTTTKSQLTTEKQPETKLAKKGEIYTISNMKYKITKVATNKYGTVTLIGSTKKPNKLKGTLKIKDSVRILGKTYRITKIGSKSFQKYKKITKVTIGKYVERIESKSFYGCKSIKKITINSKRLKKVGTKSIQGIHKKTKIYIPKDKRKKYSSYFTKKAGYVKTMKLKNK